jgi:Skp family chaperone for outer membrane proteins
LELAVVKKILSPFIISIAIFAAISGNVLAETKIAIMNYQAVLFNSAAATDATMQLRTALAPEQKRLQDLSQQIDTRRSRLETDKDLMTAEEIEQYQNDIQAMLSEQSQISAVMQKRQQESRNAFVKQFQPFIRSLVESYIEKQGITLVLDSQTVLWNQGEPDITEDILAAFDREYNAKKQEAQSKQ